MTAHARQANEQEWPVSGSPNPPAGTTRKVDEYGKIGHCDETARLDNFAIELQEGFRLLLRPGEE